MKVPICIPPAGYDAGCLDLVEVRFVVDGQHSQFCSPNVVLVIGLNSHWKVCGCWSALRGEFRWHSCDCRA